ncbi:hypothetical protein ARMGADRAFT_1063065 [Armillaria gallica]|uniref:RBR-type E3 ubiquitin transferase n=1 Tax=Armillaria gallica TaxID=47427 RepID=A0A2H3DMW4_ARMGA|nr:hypothetical protein ARMGADRAFT_1063065 [Armillaria gallica]
MSATNSTVCRNFLRGKCKNGAGCRYQHIGGASGTPHTAHNSIKNKGKKRNDSNNQCIIHDIDVQSNLSSLQSPEDYNSKDTVSCSVLQRGSCEQGEQRNFAHDSDIELVNGVEVPPSGASACLERQQKERSGQQASSSRRVKKGELPCYSWKSGSCAKGEKCFYAHDPEVQEAEGRRMEIERSKLELELERRQEEEFAMDLPRLAREAEEQREEEERQRQDEARRWEETERQRREDAKQRLDEARKQREEEQRQREEEEEARRRRVEEARRHLEEEQRKRREEQRKREEEQRQRGEDEARQQREEARRRGEEERRRQEEQRRQQEEEQRRVDQQRRLADAQVTMQRVVLAGSIVTFSSGLAIENTITGFESCRIRVKNIPCDARENEIAALFTQQGLNKFEFHVVSVKEMPGKNGKQEADIVTNANVAQSLAIGLEGLEFRDERLEFEVGVFNAPGAMDALTPRDENTLTISCRAPSVRYVVEYPDIPFCRTKVRELNGRICAGRRVKVEMNQLPPGRVVPSFRPNTIKISNLPDVVLPAIVTDFAQSHSIRPLKPLSFDIDSAIRSLQLHINRIEGVEMQSFNVTSRGDNEAGILSIRTRFNTWDDAKKVHDALLDRRFSYICNSVFWLRIAPQALYTIIIPSGQYRAQENLWKELQGNIKDRKACNIIIRELNSGDCRIQVSGTVKAALGALKVRVESLTAGEKIDGWHDHLTYPQAHLMQKITEAGAFLRSDSQKRTLKLYGEPKAVEKAKAVVMEELDRLASLEFTVTLPRPSVGYFVRTGLAAMREVFGEDSVVLDIRSAVITVRGGEEVRLHLNNHITESHKSVNVNLAPGTHTCPICYDDVSTPFQLVCEHIYCTGCIRHFLTSAAETGIFPLVCMGNESKCGRPISIPVIQKFLPETVFNHLLETVFMTHIDKRPQEFRYCKTPDCTQIYRKSEAVSVLRCPSCFSEICSSCGEDSHERMSCEDARIHNNPAEQERMRDIWLSQQRGIKKCPACSRLLEKTEGCNHMTCPCGAHICWRCMGVFGADNIYDHMGTVHGGIYADEPDPVPAQPQAAVLPPPNPDVDVFQDIDYLEQVRLLNEVEARRVAQEQYDQNRREQDRIAAYHAEAMERRRREEADREQARRLAQEQYDQNRREQDRIAAEALERRKLEVAEQERALRVAQEQYDRNRREQDRIAAEDMERRRLEVAEQERALRVAQEQYDRNRREQDRIAAEDMERRRLEQAEQERARRVAQEQYDQNRREQDRIAAEAMERRKLEQAEQEQALRVAQEQYDRNRREQDRIAAEAMERRRREEADQEQQRLERVAQRRSQQEAERPRTRRLHKEQVNRNQNERAQQATRRRQYLRRQQPPQPAASEIQAWCCVVM